MQRHDLDTAVFNIDTHSFANPGAGNDFLTAIDSRTRVQLIYFRATLQTDANVANRRVVLSQDTGASGQFYSFSSINQTNGLTWTYSFAIGVPHLDATAIANLVSVPLPDQFFINPNDPLSLAIVNKQVGDTLSNISATYKQWTTYLAP